VTTTAVRPVRAPIVEPRRRRSRARRALHPVAWWVWSLGLAATATRTTDPLLLALVIAIAGLVVATRRSAAPWGGAYRVFLLLGLTVVGIRTVFAALLSPAGGSTVLVRLPAVPLPAMFAGIRLGGPVTAEGVAAGAAAGLQLAALLACVGAANALANPVRLLRVMPAALHEVGVAVTVAVTAAPQLIASAGRVRTARRLRGRDHRGLRALAEMAVPVLHGALERSLALAASMDARGHGRRAPVGPVLRAFTAGCALAGPLTVLAGLYGLLDDGGRALLGWPLLLAGTALAAAALVLGSLRNGRTRYRPDRWSTAEWAVSGCGLAAAVAVVVAGSTAEVTALQPATVPLTVPGLPLLATLGLLVAALPAVLAPPPPVLTAEAVA
jgi:energy-coupling factor transport system permease protein